MYFTALYLMSVRCTDFIYCLQIIFILYISRELHFWLLHTLPCSCISQLCWYVHHLCCDWQYFYGTLSSILPTWWRVCSVFRSSHTAHWLLRSYYEMSFLFNDLFFYHQYNKLKAALYLAVTLNPYSIFTFLHQNV